MGVFSLNFYVMKSKLLLFSLSIIVLSFGCKAQNVLASVELEAENVTSVRIEGSFCDVVAKPGTTTYFKGMIEGSGDPDDYRIDTDIVGDELVIEVKKRGGSWNRLSKSLLELTIKNGVNLSVDNSSGNIEAGDIEAEKYSFEASSGDIDLEGVLGNMKVSTTSGDIEIREARGRLDVETTSGDQELENIIGSLDFESTSGEVSIRGFECDIIGEATSGDISLYDGSGMLKLRTTSGEIEGSRIKLTGDAEFRANSGDIEMELANSLEEMSFDLEASSGDLRVGNRSGEDELYIRNGGIWIRGITSSGSQRYTFD